jgi:hypothetical protein
LTQSNSPWFTNQIVSHSFNQNNEVEIDYPIILTSPNRLVQIDRVVILMPLILDIFGLKNSIKKSYIVIMFDGLFAHFLKNNQAFFTCVLFDHSLFHSIYLTFYLDDFAFMSLLNDFDANSCSLYWIHVGLVILFFLSW